MEKKTIGSFLSALRKANGLTQRQLADQLHVSDKAVSRWERDESAPDLTLIPVIADLFGITSDELLRGGRSGHQSAPEGKTEKQMQYLLKHTWTKHRIYCCISGTVALLGLIGAIIMNDVLLRAHLGFFVGLVFFIIAAVCQIIFVILGRSAIDWEDCPVYLTAPVRKKMILLSELVFGLIIALFSGCLPLILLPDSPFQGLGATGWLIYGICFAAFFTVLWGILCAVINQKQGLWRKIDWHCPANRLRLRWLKKAALILAAILTFHLASATLISQNYHLLVRGTQFYSWDDFRRYMETPTDTDGTPLTFQTVEGNGIETVYVYKNQHGNPVALRKEDVTQILYDTDSEDTELVRYRHLNRQIVSVRLNKGNLPVQVFTSQQLLTVQIITALMHLFWFVTALLAVWILRKQYLAEKQRT